MWTSKVPESINLNGMASEEDLLVRESTFHCREMALDRTFALLVS